MSETIPFLDLFEMFPWNNNFESGITLIDDQHKCLVSILNRLAAHLANRSKPAMLREIFGELTDYADYHFATEERLFHTHLEADEFLQHQQSHREFITEISIIKSLADKKPYEAMIREIIRFLAKWLVYHILDSDRRMLIMIREIEDGHSVHEAKKRSEKEIGGSTDTLIETVLHMYDNLSTRTLDLMREKALRFQAERTLTAREDCWNFILESNRERIWDWDIVKDSASHSDNEEPLFNRVICDFERLPGSAQIHPADIEKVQSDLQAHLDNKSDFFFSKHRVMRFNGTWSWVIMRGKVINREESGKALRMIGTHSDVTERELASLIFKHSSQAMLITDLNNEIISINPAFEQTTGYSEPEVLGRDPKVLSSGKHNGRFFKEIWREINEKGHWRGEIRNLKKNGEEFHSLLSINAIYGNGGETDHYVGLFSDITQQKQFEEVIVRQANHDSLTNLPNRHMNEELMEQEIRRYHRYRIPFALLFIDLDNFKEINDTFNHEVGDELLIQAAKRISLCIRESDTVARFGGDEFTVITANLKDLNKVDRIAQSLIDVLCQPFSLDENTAYISASIGITIYPRDGGNVAELLRNADQAMYLAKESGKGRFAYFTPEIQAEALDRRSLQIELRNAVNQQEFEVHYQPIIKLQSGKTVKAEALLRWPHSERGMISPHQFTPLAEESGLIVPLGRWVIEKVAKQACAWRESMGSDFQISVNRSPLEFRESQNLDMWFGSLDELGLLPANIIIEITESLLMENQDYILDQLLALRRRHVEVALDDFGTGYSSLSYIRNFHIDYIKIDSSFVKNLAVNTQEAALCEGIISMAHKLDIKVVAEGVETAIHHNMLKAMNCDYAQGYYYSRPLPAAEFERLPDRLDHR